MAPAIGLRAGHLLILLNPSGYIPSKKPCLVDFMASAWAVLGKRVSGVGGVTGMHNLRRIWVGPRDGTPALLCLRPCGERKVGGRCPLHNLLSSYTCYCEPSSLYGSLVVSSKQRMYVRSPAVASQDPPRTLWLCISSTAS